MGRYNRDMKKFFVHSKAGSLGEELACRYLKKKGYKILAQNYYFDKGKRSGEIDIIANYQGTLHFIEVKTRLIQTGAEKSRALYFPIEAQVTPQKIQKCLKTVQHYLRATKSQDQEYHFDLITVLYSTEEKKAEIQYLPDIFY